MTNLIETPTYEPGVFQLEITTPVLGGTPTIVSGEPMAGHANAQALQLANRTAYLKGILDKKLTHVVVPEQFGAVGNGIADDTEALYQAILTGYPVTLRNTYKITATRTVPSLRFIGAGGSIVGGNFLGYRISSGFDLSGDMLITGFSDGTQDQKLNYATAFCRINTGSIVDKVFIGKGVKATNCRALITAGSETSDVLADKTITVKHFHCQNLITDNVMQVVMLRCVTELATGGYNDISNCIGASRVVGGFLFYLDGIGQGDPAYARQGSQVFIGDRFKNLINRTTTGDSTTGNNYETHAYMLYGNGAFITDPNCEDVTGTAFDCEAVYSKTKRLVVRGGRFVNCGTEEGAIVAKGASFEANITNNAKGGICDIRGTVIEFTRYSYDNNGTIVPLTCRGVTVAATYNAYVDVRVIGGNADADVRLDGYLNTDSTTPSLNSGCTIRVESEKSLSGGAVIARGAFHDLDIWARAIDVKTSGRNWATIRYLSVSGRGLDNKNHKYWHQTQMNNSNLSGFDVCGILVDNENYNIDGLLANDCVWDVVASGAVLKPFSFDAQTGAPIGVGTNIEIRNWKFMQELSSPPVVFDGSFNPKSYVIDLQFTYLLTDNTTNTPIQGRLSGNQGSFFLEGSLLRRDSMGHGILQPQISGIYYDAAGTATIIGTQVAPAAVGDTTATTSIALNASGANVRARINGNDLETYLANIRFKAFVGL